MSHALFKKRPSYLQQKKELIRFKTYNFAIISGKFGSKRHIEHASFSNDHVERYYFHVYPLTKTGGFLVSGILLLLLSFKPQKLTESFSFRHHRDFTITSISFSF